MVKPTTWKAYCKLVDRDVEASRVSIPTGHGQVIRQSECRNFEQFSIELEQSFLLN